MSARQYAGPLFERQPAQPAQPHPATLARATDPVESLLGAIQATASGLVSERARAALAAVQRLPDRTAGELAAADGVERTDYGRRLPELLAQGFVVKSGSRRCAATGHRAATWRVASTA